MRNFTTQEKELYILKIELEMRKVNKYKEHLLKYKSNEKIRLQLEGLEEYKKLLNDMIYSFNETI
jgi:hypothetical protein